MQGVRRVRGNLGIVLRRESPYRSEPLIDRTCRKSERLQMKSEPQHDAPVEGQPRFGAVPGYELLHRKLVVASRARFSVS